MDSKENFRELKKSISESIERAKQNAEDLHVIENALQENLKKLKELRKAKSGGNPPKRK